MYVTLCSMRDSVYLRAVLFVRFWRVYGFSMECDQCLLDKCGISSSNIM